MTIKKLLFISGILLVAAASVSIASLINIGVSTRIIVNAQDKRTISLQLADEIRDSSRDLTDAVRRFVITGNEQYYDEYIETLMIRSGEMSRHEDSQIAPGQLVSLGKLIKSAGYTERELSLLEQSLNLSDELAALEIEAMNLMLPYKDDGGAHQDTAKDIIFSPDYDAAVAGIMEPFSQFKQELDQRLNDDITLKRQNRDHSAVLLWASFFVLIVMFTVILVLIALVIVRPVLLCDRFAKQIAEGVFEDTLEYRSGNEVGSLAESLRCMLKSLRERIGLEESARYFGAVVSSVGAGIIIRDRDGLITAWNSGAERILGYKAEEIIGKTPDYYYPEEFHSMLNEMQERMKSGEHVAHIDVNRKHKDGRLVRCSSSLTPIFNNDGVFISSVAVFHDVTAQKAAEEKAQRLAAIIAIADAGIIVKDKNGVVQDWNIGAENILGYKPEEIIGHTTKYYAPKEAHADIDEIERRLGVGEHITHVDVVRKHKDGRLIDCSASYTPIFGNNNEFTGSVSIFHDITDKKSAEQKARRLAAIVSATDAGIVVKDADCNILDWNIGAESILGYKPEEIIGKNTKYFVPAEYFTDIDDIKERLLRGEHTSHVEVVRRHKDGRLIDCSTTYTPVYDEHGEFVGSIAVFQDISYKKEIERALEEAVQKAEEESKAKSIFLANMSHEIRTPMNGIIGFAELALAEAEITGSIRGYLSKIKTSADNLLTIINDILDVSKIEAGAMELEYVPFSLHEIFRDCETISSIKAAQKGIALHFYAEPFIGKKLVGDSTKLRQVLLNLLSNAIKFTNYGMVKLTAVIVEDKNDSAKILFEVKDSGIGMTPEQMQKIFDPFTQADNSTTRKYGGTGLGLSITKNFVELMGGTLKLESTLGLGSKFSFLLSFETVSTPDIEPQKNDEPLFAQKPVFAGDILICEDNPINQEVIQKHLERLGLTCVVAVNGKQGVEVVKERLQKGSPFELILMDIHMPVMDGLEAMQKLIEIGNSTPVVALTANAMITDREKYLECGMADYLSKPFTVQDLWSCLTRHLKQVDCALPSNTDEEMVKLNESSDKQMHLINEETGLENATGDEKFYRHLQKRFYKDNQNTMQKLTGLLRENRIKAAHRVVHTMKSSAGMIGAEKLALVAGKVEAMLKDRGKNCPSEILESLQCALTEVLAALEPYSAIDEPKPKDAACGSNKNKAISLIEALAPLLKSGNPESTDFIDEVRMHLSHYGEACESLAVQIEEYDFDDAFESLSKLKAMIDTNMQNN